VKPNRLVCLGSSGFLGCAVAETFSRSQIPCLGLDIKEGPYTQHVLDFEKISLEQWRSLAGSQTAIFFALGRADVWSSDKDPEGDFNAYIKPLQKLLAMLGGEETLYLVSSAAVYSAASCPSEGFSEQDTLASASVYGRHRILGEELLKAYAEEHPAFNYQILRPFSVFGGAQHKQVIFDLSRRFLENERKGESTLVFGTGEESRDFIHVSLVGEFCKEVFEAPQPSQSWNLCSGSGITIRELAQKIQEHFHLKQEFSFNGESRPPIHLRGNAGRLQGLLDPSLYGLKPHLKATLDAYGHFLKSSRL
jgi:UDP-glucose 4-epimerase